MCVPVGDPAWSHLERSDDLPGDLAQEIEHFFTVYGDLQGKQLRVEGWGTHDAAARLIEEGWRRAGAVAPPGRHGSLVPWMRPEQSSTEHPPRM